MPSFGIRFSAEIRGSVETPPGFCASEISLGDYREICFSDCSKWSPEQYVEHWKLSAKVLINKNVPQLFCSSLEEKNAALWTGIPKGTIVVFYNKIAKISDLKIDNLMVSPRRAFSDFVGEPSPEWSCWKVPVADLKRLADG